MVAVAGSIGSATDTTRGKKKDMKSGTIGVNNGRSEIAGIKAIETDGSGAAMRKRPSLVKRFVKRCYDWLGVGKADDYAEQAMQLRKCRLGMDKCTESMRNADNP